MMRITMNPAMLTEYLIDLGWDPKGIQLMYDRIMALADNGEGYIDISRRLNPAKATQPAWEPSPFRGQTSRGFPERVLQKS